MPASPPSKLFIIYAREDQPALLELKAHLRPLEKRGDLIVWYDGEILPGQDWDKVIKTQLATADIVLLFISKYFFNSEYIEREELKKALERHGKGETIVVPVIVKPCLWDTHPEISTLQVLPKNGKAVSGWADADEAFTDVARGVQKLIGQQKKQVHGVEEAKIAAQKVEEAIKAYDAGQIETAFQILLQYATSKYSVNPRGYHLLGYTYHYGKGGVNINYEEAIKWYMKGGEHNYLNSFINIGIMYYNGEGVIQDYTEAVKWYRKAAEQGNSLGQSNLGDMHQNGKGVTQNHAEAVKWYREAAEQGDTTGQNNLGVMYENGQGVAQNYNEAVKWYRKAAEQGDATGQNNLGFMYINGYGVKQDYNEAVKWFQKAAEQGGAEGQTNLGFLYDNGYGVTKDIPTAVQWYRKAAAQGNEIAKNNLKLLGYSE